MQGVYINGSKGELIEVTDFQAALTQAQWCVKLHEEAKQSTSPDVIYFEDAHNHWQKILTELEKLQLKLNHNENSN